MEYINFLGDLFMVRINYLVHMISGILYAVLGIFLLLPAMFISFQKGLFDLIRSLNRDQFIAGARRGKPP